MGIAAIAKCRWFWWHPVDQKWTAEDDEPDEVTSCRASVGQRWVSVWLPRGAMIRRRIPRKLVSTEGHEFRHTYGADRDRQIRFTVELVPGPQKATRKPKRDC